jgi:hypothetical protein
MSLQQPKLSLNFTTATLSPLITFTRIGATATRVNSSGLIESVAADTARFDFNPVTAACRGLLIEEQRTNSIPASNGFSAATWSTAGTVNLTPVSAQATSPDGTANGWGFSDGSATGSRAFLSEGDVTAGQAYTISGYFKQDTHRYVQLLGGGGRFGTTVFGNFDLQTGTKGSIGAGVTNQTMTDAGNGWWRCSISGVCTSTGTSGVAAFGHAVSNTATRLQSYTGTNTRLFVFGFQSEPGDLTSYIPTAGAAVTRNADVATITGTAFSGFWRSGPGSILVRALPGTVSGTRPLVQVDDATADDIIALRGNTTNPELYIREGGADQATIDAGTISAAAYRLAGAWQAGSAAVSLNSGLAVNGAPASIPAATQMRLGSDGTNYLNGHLQAVQYWPLRLSNAGLQNASSTAGYGGILASVMQDTTLYPQINRSFGL